GVNFIDTAEMYSIPPRAETYGSTETIIGNWLKKTGKRDRIVLATKVVGKADDWLPHIRGGKARLDKKNIESALDQSLRRLQTDYVDLYQIHWPDRNTNFFGELGYRHQPDESAVSIEETLSALNGLVESGKVRCLGVSNETPWGAMEYLRVAAQNHFPRIVSIQNPYNLLNRSFEIGLSEISHREEVGLLAYSPLAFGVLTGKYLFDSPENARLTLFPSYTRYSSGETGKAATEAYVRLARAHGLSPAQMALAFVNSRPFLSANIIGATTLAQLRENLESAYIELSGEVLDGIEAIHREYPNPCP
ncbi:MAG: aldo/keto reductase, partial [Gammaproteobacteria bacterium]